MYAFLCNIPGGYVYCYSKLVCLPSGWWVFEGIVEMTSFSFSWARVTPGLEKFSKRGTEPTLAVLSLLSRYPSLLV